MVRNMLGRSADLDDAAAACRQAFMAVDEADGPRIDRTEHAIKKRYADLQKNKVLTVRKARRWTKNDDRYLMTQIQAALGDEAKEGEAVKIVAKRLDVRPNFVRQRLSWMKLKLTRKDSQSTQSTTQVEDENLWKNVSSKDERQRVEVVESPRKDIESMAQYDKLTRWLRSESEGDSRLANPMCDEEERNAAILSKEGGVRSIASGSDDADQVVDGEFGGREEADVERHDESSEDERDASRATNTPSSAEVIDVCSDSDGDEPAGVIVDREVTYFTGDKSSEYNFVTSDDGAGSDDEPEDSSLLAANTKDEEDDERAEWKEDMRQHLLTLFDDKGERQSAQPCYHEYIRRKSSARKHNQETVECQAWCAEEGGNRYKELLPCSHNPKLSRRRVRQLLFVLTLIRPDRDMTDMFLRELWASSYGMCRSGACGLGYDWDYPDYEQFKGCRHWEYYFYREVYFDNFAVEGDYRLAAALAIHLEAREATCDYAWKSHRGKWMYHRLELCGYGPFIESFKEWSGNARFTHALCAFGRISSLRVNEDYVYRTAGKIDWCNGTYG